MSNLPNDITRHELERVEETGEYVELTEEIEVLKKQASKLEVEIADDQYNLNLKTRELDGLEEQITKLEYKIDNYGNEDF
jgi:predicted  nucleic acid-binding Zn-ribbon protein